MTFIDEMRAHAAADAPNEACGLVVQSGKKPRLVRARNVAAHPRTTFDLDPDAWFDVAEHEAVIGIYHSHPSTSADPSLADRSACELSGLPWHIVDLVGGYQRIEPSGFRAPYLKRPYVHGVHDCYAIIRDWFEWDQKISLPNYPRTHEWWLRGGNLYLDNFADAGFVEVDDEPREGDVFLIQIQSPVPNHACVYLGNGTILHHVENRLSSCDVWGGMWSRHATHHLRHNRKMGSTRDG